MTPVAEEVCPPAILSVKAACRETTLSRSTLWRLVKSGQFPAPVKLSPGRVGFRATEVHAWIAAR